ncbi:MAG: hypothetical protein IJX49_00155 [Clostridia bacterium]|nr:hypothetical protein [Clostridia bacterium]
MSKKLTSASIVQIVKAAFVLVLGILFCISQVAGVLSVIIGISLIVVGALYIVNAYLKDKRLLTSDGVMGILFVAFGIVFWENTMMAQVLALIPWILISAGVVVIADSVLRAFVAYSIDMKNFVIELVIGIIVLALGICLKAIPAFAEFTSIMVGIVLVVYALMMIAGVFLNLDKYE